VRNAIAEMTGIPLSHIRISYTHTHSGPILDRGWSPWMGAGREMVASYGQSLPDRIAGAAWAAVNALRPARIAGGAGQCRINVNRRFQRPGDGAVVVGRNWEGPVDHEVQVLRIDGPDRQPLAAVVNYACHPIIVGPDCDRITPDFPGVVKQVVEQATGAPCLFLQGAAGNLGPVRGVARGGLGEFKRLGAVLGHEASRVWWEIETEPHRERYTGTLESGAPLAMYDDVPVATGGTTIRVGTRPMHLPLKELPPPEALAAEYEAHVARLAELRASGDDDAAIRWETMGAKRTAMRAQLSTQLQDQTHRTLEAQAFAIGDEIALVAMPGEPFAEIGMGVKRASPFRHTLFSGYSNVGWAYIPTADAYPLGGYEVEITPFEPSAADQIVAESLALLGGLAAE
jgi:neutral ceramidase